MFFLLESPGLPIPPCITLTGALKVATSMQMWNYLDLHWTAFSFLFNCHAFAGIWQSMSSISTVIDQFTMICFTLKLGILHLISCFDNMLPHKILHCNINMFVLP